MKEDIINWLIILAGFVFLSAFFFWADIQLEKDQKKREAKRAANGLSE